MCCIGGRIPTLELEGNGGSSTPIGVLGNIACGEAVVDQTEEDLIGAAVDPAELDATEGADADLPSITRKPCPLFGRRSLARAAWSAAEAADLVDEAAGVDEDMSVLVGDLNSLIFVGDDLAAGGAEEATAGIRATLGLRLNRRCRGVARIGIRRRVRVTGGAEGAKRGGFRAWVPS